MELKKRPRVRTLGLNAATMTHLHFGTCHLAGAGEGCACGLVDRQGEFVAEAAAHLWSKHRKEIERQWPHPFPTFAGALFARQTMPTMSLGWPDRSQGAYLIVAEELAKARAETVPVLPS